MLAFIGSCWWPLERWGLPWTAVACDRRWRCGAGLDRHGARPGPRQRTCL